MWTLLKYDLKTNWLLIAIFSFILSFYMSVIIYMYDPTSIAATEEMFEMLPTNMVDAFGFGGIANDLTGFIAGYYYGFLVFIFPMIFCIITGNRLIAKYVDNGSMAYLLQTPLSRTKLAITQGAFFLLSLVIIFGIAYGVGVNVCQSLFPGLLNVVAFTKLHGTAFLLTTVIAMICFYYSCYFDDTKNSLSFGAGTPITMLLMLMMGGIADQISWVKDLSIYSLLNAPEIVQNGNTLGLNLAFIIISSILFVVSVKVFASKQLSL